MDHQQPYQNLQGFQYYQPHAYGQAPYNNGTVSGHLPQHGSHVEEQHQQQWHHSKRPRDSPTFSDGDGTIQHSFKRLKVADECSSTTDSIYSTITNYSSFDSRFDANAGQIQRENNHLIGFESQAPGQQSSEPTVASYQPMNSLLGNLHMLRKQREAQPSAQHPAIDHRPPPWDHAAVRPTNPGRGKKQVSLRVSSKLY
eukprot:CAMPEP_0176084812 /NCGR_PEP_ID=MMETSP0120_2-20121206/42444_1 /TAXON_ID=160619 /ORGANISM="Kryptoperidinium foliaceum, Strain CCMP 1326" /LENGTH=198 /DNA_ID=CAMNT_0017418621 /DNA_START=154 /DNA_END=750 /DNA_ORIENTATION=+